jgi:iron complex transport system ATP-binding protein
LSAFLSARTASYHWRGRALVDSINLDVALGQVTIIVGPNGAGKSSLLRLLSGELAPTNGQIFCDGQTLRRLPAWLLACKRVVMTQSAQLSFPFTVYEVARLGLDGVGKSLSSSRRKEFVEQCLASADVLHLAPRRYDLLSGGEQRRVQFARALAQLQGARSASERQALLLDEPVANLDLRHQLALLDTARSIAATGVAVLIVLHDLNLAARYADTIAIMNNGSILAHGEPRLVFAKQTLSELFGVPLAITEAGGGIFATPTRWIEALKEVARSDANPAGLQT